MITCGPTETSGTNSNDFTTTERYTMTLPSADYDLAMHLHRDFERARRQLTMMLEPYLERFFDLERKTTTYFDKTEAEAKYEFSRLSADGNFFEFVALDYHD